MENAKLKKLKIDNYNVKLSAATISSLIDNNSDSLYHLELQNISSNDVRVTRPLQIVSLNLTCCDPDLEISILSKCCLHSLQSLALCAFTNWDMNIAALSNLQSVRIDGRLKDISECQLLTQEGK